MLLVQLADEVERITARRGRDTIRIPEEEHRVPLRSELHALVDRRKESASPAGFAPVRVVLTRKEHHESRQVRALASETVGEPGAHARTSHDLMPGVHEDLRGSVVELRGVHRADDGNLVDHTREVGKELRDFSASFPVSRERVWRAENLGNAPDEGEALAFEELRRAILSIQLLELLLGLEEVEVRGSSRHEEVDDAFRLRRKVGSEGPALSLEKTEESGASDAEPRLTEEVAPRDGAQAIGWGQALTPW